MTQHRPRAREIKPLRNTFTHVARYIGGDKPATRATRRARWRPAAELPLPADLGAAVRAVRCLAQHPVKLADWYVLRDPRQYYYASWTMARSRQQEAVEANYQFVGPRNLLAKLPDAVRASVLPRS